MGRGGRLGIGGLVLAALVAGVQYLVPGADAEREIAPASEVAAEGWDYLREARERQRSKIWMEVSARVVKILPDDNDGDRHQRFLVANGAGPKVLVAHNIDLAGKVPVNEGDSVQIRGRYEWNEKGGVLHWTHRDPRDHIKGGWIIHAGRTYR